MKKIFPFLVWLSISLLTIDTIYRTVFGITYQTREKCILYTNLPKWMFLTYEYIIELILILIVGIFLASLFEKYSSKLVKVLPKNPISSFLFASLIPVCSCGAVPFVRGLRKHISTQSLITFLVAAPLLNPYILFLSFSVLGIKFAVLRFVFSGVIAIGSGYILALIPNFMPKDTVDEIACGKSESCSSKSTNVYDSTFIMFKKVAPYVLVAGILGIAFEVFQPTELIESMDLGDSIWSVILITIVGIPVYFCNGADVFFLKPLYQFTDLDLGTGLAFSLSSTSICISSIIILSQYLGKKQTTALTIAIFILTIISGIIINYFT